MAPTLREIVGLFGETGRVRLSTVEPGGKLLGWHPDVGSGVGADRIILHLALQTSPCAFTWLGHLALAQPENELWYGDYGFPHTVFNAHPTLPRTHLVVEVLR